MCPDIASLPRQQADLTEMLELYRTLALAAAIDALEEQYAARGEAFFHVAGVGHAASAALARALAPGDLLHLHYRDKALLLARGVPASQFFLSLFCKDASHSRGRQMSAHMCAPELGVLSMVGPVGNNALQAAGAAAALKGRPGAPIAVCALGDGTAQQGEVLEAIAEAARSQLPLLFLIEDNGLAISVRTTGRTFWHLSNGAQPADYLGIPIHRIDGSSVSACAEAFAQIVPAMRANQSPAIVIMNVERLTDHTNADAQESYRPAQEIEAARAQHDPLARFAEELIARGVLSATLDTIQREARAAAESAAADALAAAEPEPSTAALPPFPVSLQLPQAPAGPQAQRTMLESIRDALGARLAADASVYLWGQDIEDPKGDVFGITRGLSTAHPGRVENAPLTESTIVGVAIGRAMAGQHPVAMLQFSDFLPLAFNQIACELATIPWRTDGAIQAPVIVMAPCGGYKPGLGPFHAQTNDSLVAHVPGLDVAIPSTAADAAGLLNAAFASRRPTVFLYPKALLNDRSLATPAGVDAANHVVPFGVARRVQEGDDLTLVAWGNAVPHCVHAADFLRQANITTDVIDLRTLAPWDRDAVLTSANRTGRLIVVHEDNVTGGFGAEIVASIAEHAPRPIAMRRVARPDVPVPCHFPSQLAVLPSARSILATAAELLQLDITWEHKSAEHTDPSLFVMEAIGTSPTDEMISVTAWRVAPGDHVAAGQIVADIEADKASGELASPVTGIVESLCIERATPTAVGSPFITIRLADGAARPAATIRTADDKPLIRRRTTDSTPTSAQAPATRTAVRVAMSQSHAVSGSIQDLNSDVIKGFPGRTEEEIVKICGIARRARATPEETPTELCKRAVRKLWQQTPNFHRRLSLVVAATGTTDLACPNLASLMLAEVGRLAGEAAPRAGAFDLNAACAGWVYALQAAYDHVAHRPDDLVLVVSADTLTPLVNPADFGTRIIFGDGASATLVGTPETLGESALLYLHRPRLYAKPDTDMVLTAPALGVPGYISMDGQRVFREAVRAMIDSLKVVCRDAGLTGPEQLDLVVPHQANQRILDAVERTAGLTGKVFSNIRHLGNTSASTIPLAMNEIAANTNRLHSGAKVGLVAFGGGFTYGAALAEVL